MGASILTMSIAGLLAGFIFSMPIAGPISILITSNAFKGRLRYCNLVSIGASIADFTYVFIAVFGLTRLYSLYKPAIPYILSGGSIFFIILGYKIIRTKIDIEHLEDKSHLTEKIKKKEKGAFYTGLMINFLNPTLFIGVLTSSFFVISLIASLGFHTGGLATKMDQNVKEISNIEGKKIEKSQGLAIKQFDKIQMRISKDHQEDLTTYPTYFHVVISICYAFFLSFGSIIWFFLMAFLIVRFRRHINVNVISAIIKGLGVVLCIIGLYFGYLGIRMFISM
ncbi:MAG: LysE family transporter [Bacteroidales bacterium]|jgi:threonine/homoserine/homoserine lactone efflux protein